MNIVWKTTLVVAWEATILNHSHSAICSSHNHGADIADTGLISLHSCCCVSCCDNSTVHTWRVSQATNMVKPWLWGIPLVLITVEAQVWEMWCGICIGMNCIQKQKVELFDT